MAGSSTPGPAHRAFRTITARPRLVVAVSALAVLACAAGLPRIHQDSRVEAFIPSDHEAMTLRRTIETRFGMSDPMAILVVSDGPRGVFDPRTLALVEHLTAGAKAIAGVQRESVTSLATVRVVESTDAGIAVTPVLEAGADAEMRARAAERRIAAHPLLDGSLVAEDGRSTLVAIERFDHGEGSRIYRELLDLVTAAPVEAGEQLFVAGHGALTATLGEYIDSDTRILYVLVTVLIGAVLAAAFRTFWGVALPLVLIGATLAVTLGAMGLADAPFTVITSALPVVLSSLVVTDGLHILSLYYSEQAAHPQGAPRDWIVAAMAETWRPCVGARVTDIAGFAGLYLGSAMPPMKTFGLYGSVGIAGEMLLAMLAYPCLVLLVAPRPSPAFAAGSTHRSVSLVRRFLDRLAAGVLVRSRLVLGVALAIVVAGATGIDRMVVNDSWVGNFNESSDVALASAALGERYGMRTDLDLLVDSGEVDGALDPSLLARIEGLQNELAGLPYVTRSRSIVDYLREIDRAMRGSEAGGGELPADGDLVAQYLLVADPDETRKWIDGEQRRALVRVHTLAQDYLQEVRLLGELEPVLERTVAGSGATVSEAGMVAVGHAWVSSVGQFHVLSTALSVGFCWLQMVAGFRSWFLGTLAIVPMTAAMLLMYAVMGWFGIPLGVGTSMFAALAIGTGVDFAIHTVDRFLVLRERGERSLEAAIAEILPTTGRTVLFSATAILLGFSVLCTSSIPAVRSLGVLVTVAVAASLVATLTILPVLIKVLRPAKLPGGVG